MGRLDGKVAIITGAANGIGLAAVRVFAKEDAKVVIADFDENTGKQQEKILQEEGVDCRFIQVNVADWDSCKQLADETIQEYGRIDILVNNAGITRDAMLTKIECRRIPASHQCELNWSIPVYQSSYPIHD